MIIPIAKVELLKVIIDAFTNAEGFSKIHWCIFHRLWITIRDGGLIGGQVSFSIEHEQVISDRGVSLSGEVEVGVVCQVEDGSLVGLGLVDDVQCIVLGEVVDDGDLEVAGITLLSIG